MATKTLAVEMKRPLKGGTSLSSHSAEKDQPEREKCMLQAQAAPWSSVASPPPPNLKRGSPGAASFEQTDKHQGDRLLWALAPSEKIHIHAQKKASRPQASGMDQLGGLG